jgi:hypothetical protein
MRIRRSQTGAAIGFVAITLGLLVCTDTTNLVVPHAKAYVIKNNFCGGYTYRAAGGHPVIEMCLAPPGFPGLPNATDLNANDYAAAKAGMLSAYWMWVREGTSNATLFVDGAAGCGDGTGFNAWYDNGDQKNNSWWETTASIQGVGGGCASATACTSTDLATCILPYTSTRIIAADIAVSHQDVFGVVNQDTLVDCLRTTFVNHETMWLHEIGHAYGLDHDDATVSVMKTAIGNLMRNCHTAQNFHNYPFPDDINGFMAHHKGYTGTKWNWAGTPWARQSGMDTVQSVTHVVTSNTKSVSAIVTIHSYYGTGQTPTIRLFLVPTTTQPTFNFTTKVWTMNSVQQGGLYTVGPAFGIESRRITQTATFGGPSLPVGVYRVWVKIDADDVFVSEPDEGDNVFPTDVKFNRTAG